MTDIPHSDTWKSGFAAILGRPNAGKSTLVNAVMGEKLVAVSGLPQTTRDRINAIWSGDGLQIVFVDLPGLVEASDRLNEALRENVIEGLEGVDCVIHLLDTTDPDPVGEDMRAVLDRVTTPVVCALNKVDRQPADFDAHAWLREQEHAPPPERYAAVLTLSASTGPGVQELVETVASHMPEGPPLYDPDDLTDRDLRFLTSELIREKVFHLTHQEVPYSTAVQIEEFQERARGKWYIAATIYIERDSQKGLIIGKGGSMLKKISTAARADIEALVQTPVFLELHVKVAKNWKKDENRLRQFGYGHKRRR